MMRRCIFCKKRLWFWQHYGFWVDDFGVQWRWHTRCKWAKVTSW